MEALSAQEFLFGVAGRKSVGERVVYGYGSHVGTRECTLGRSLGTASIGHGGVCSGGASLCQRECGNFVAMHAAAFGCSIGVFVRVCPEFLEQFGVRAVGAAGVPAQEINRIAIKRSKYFILQAIFMF